MCVRTARYYPATVYSASAVYRLPSTVYSLQCTVYSLQSTVYSLQSTVYSLQPNAQCTTLPVATVQVADNTVIVVRRAVLISQLVANTSTTPCKLAREY